MAATSRYLLLWMSKTATVFPLWTFTRSTVAPKDSFTAAGFFHSAESVMAYHYFAGLTGLGQSLAAVFSSGTPSAQSAPIAMIASPIGFM